MSVIKCLIWAAFALRCVSAPACKPAARSPLCAPFNERRANKKNQMHTEIPSVSLGKTRGPDSNADDVDT